MTHNNTHTRRALPSRQLVATLALSLSLWGCPDADPPGATDMGPELDMRMTTVFPDYGGVEAGVTVGGTESGTMAGTESGTMAGTESGTTAGAMAPETCTPCEADDECADGELCVQMTAGGEGRCFAPCGIEEGSGDETGCPDGVACTTLSPELSVCVPDDEDRCEAFCYDQDGDGFGVGDACSAGRDCNDADPSVFQGASDLCDGVDNDCDGNADEDFMSEVCGVGACAATSTCAEGVETACVPGAPAGEDLTCDGLDDDCDGSADEDYMPLPCGFGTCASMSACEAGVEQACEPSAPSTADDLSCDGVDDDCDGNTDEDFFDSCGQGLCSALAVCANNAVSCEPREADPLETDAQCDGVDSDCDGSADEAFTPTPAQSCGLGVCFRDATCASGAVSCTPGAPLAATDETCDGVDDDCDGEIDEDCQVNTMTASYNASESTGDVVAIDIYYVQEHSPTHDGIEWQPTTLNVAVNFPAGMTPRGNLLEGQAFRAGPATIAAGKNINARRSQNLEGMLLNQAQYTIISTQVGNDVNPVAPANPTSPSSGLLMTVYFSVNGVAFPWIFSWDEVRTSMAPDRAMGALEFATMELISP